METQMLKERYSIFSVEVTNQNYRIFQNVNKQRQNSFK